MNAENSLKKPLGITMGCPAGIGPEIILKYFHARTGNFPPMVVIGDLAILERTGAELNMKTNIRPWIPGTPVDPETLSVYGTEFLLNDIEWGQPTVATGKSMVGYIEETVALIEKKFLSGMVTCPISKIALKQSGSSYPGHTEMLAALTGAKRFRMMMAGQRLKVVLVTIHEPLSRVSDLLSQEAIFDCIDMTIRSLREDFALPEPRVAVAGLNPHCGECGMFGTEEGDCIGPAVAAYSGAGSVSGPWPPDTVFYQAATGAFDAVIAMYHDQGLIPFKLLHFKDGVNVTLGLPLVRTSVDHGTAYDIAGRGLADSSSLAAAVHMASEIVKNRTGEIAI